MDVRDAVEADADALADLSGSPVDVMRNLVHDRTVRVALAPDTEAPEARNDGDDGEHEARHGTARIAGFVSFDARGETVHVTQIAGSESACTRLLEEPIRFARREEMSVELLVPQNEGAVRTAVEASDFERVGEGPRFDGRPTARYRLDPATEMS